MLVFDVGAKPIYSIALSPDGATIAVACRDAPLRFVGLDGSVSTIDGGTAVSVAYHPAGWYAAGGPAGWRALRPAVPAMTANDSATALAFLDEHTLVVGLGDRVKTIPGSLELWDLRTGRRREPRFVDGHSTRAIAVHVATRTVAWSTATRNKITIWDSTRQTPTVIGLMHAAPSLAFHPDGESLAVAGEWGVRIFSVARERVLLTLTGHKGVVSSVLYSPDGRTIITGSWDRTVRIWDAATGQEIRCFDWPTGRVYCLAYAPDGLRMAAAGDAGTVVVWDME